MKPDRPEPLDYIAPKDRSGMSPVVRFFLMALPAIVLLLVVVVGIAYAVYSWRTTAFDIGP